MLNNATRTNPSILITKFLYYDIQKELLIYLTIKQFQELLEKVYFCENYQKGRIKNSEKNSEENFANKIII